MVCYFQEECKTDKIDSARKAFDTLTNCGTKHMLLFLQYILQKVNALNIDFQSEQFRLHQLHAMITLEYKSILACFIKEEVLHSKKLSEIDPQDTRNQKSISDVYLSGNAVAHLITNLFQNESCSNSFKTDCFKFLVELSIQIKKRSPMDENEIIAEMNVLDAKIAQDCSNSPVAKMNVLDKKITQDCSNSPVSIVPFAVRFLHVLSHILLNELDDQRRTFRAFAKTLVVPTECVPDFWYNLGSVKDGLGNDKFPLLSYFMTTMTVLTHFSASVERIFSQINRMKTKLTSSLQTERVEN